MNDIICVSITALSTIVCAVIAVYSKKSKDMIADNTKKSEVRAKQRAEESRLQLAMISANTKLVIGVAMALKHGHCNGEVEEGLASVKEANEEYVKFLEGVAIDQLNK